MTGSAVFVSSCSVTRSCFGLSNKLISYASMESPPKGSDHDTFGAIGSSSSVLCCYFC
jgi:hypothetical protein